MRQRVMIAMAISCNPKLLIADEPTTALDVTVQAQILELMKDLSQRLDIALIFITHNLGIVARYADRVVVMYAGKPVEQAPVAVLFKSPRHPYTIGLLRVVPRLDRLRGDRLETIEGLPPNFMNLPPGCRFAPRCPWQMPKCAEEPGLDEVEPQHRVACWRAAGDAEPGPLPSSGRGQRPRPARFRPAEPQGSLEAFRRRGHVRGRGQDASGRRCHPRRACRRNAGSRRGKRLRQDDPRAPGAFPGKADRRADPVRGPGHRQAAGRPAAAEPPPDPGGVPGSL